LSSLLDIYNDTKGSLFDGRDGGIFSL
jgi:hypothetical protein